MKGSYNSRYKKRNQETGVLSTIFTYHLSGSTEELTRYSEIQTEAGFEPVIDEGNGKMLYFDTTYHGPVCKILITHGNKVVVDNPTLDFLQSQMSQVTDPTVKAAMATQIASFMVQQIAGNAVTSASTAPVTTTQQEPEVIVDEEPVIEEEPAEDEPVAKAKKAGKKEVNPSEASL